MKCAWQSYVGILPQSIRTAVEPYRDSLTEVRMRIYAPIELVTTTRTYSLKQNATLQEISYCINVASKYSPWAVSTVSKGYITAAGGHRIGICGEVVMKDGLMSGIATPTSISIRVARDFPGIAARTSHLNGSILIIGPPGAGKTTLLRDLIRLRSDLHSGSVAVVDERREIFPFENGTPSFPCGKQTDILSGCSKAQGIQILLKNMTPHYVAVDEITSHKDCSALIDACWCGVKLICTAHAESRTDLLGRGVYRPLVESKIFDWLIVIDRHRSWNVERM